MPFGLLFLAAAVAGFVGALDGIGGGLVLTPILTAFGVDIREAIAINSVSVIAISSIASPPFLRHHLPNLKVCAFLECFAISGALLGAALTGAVSRHTLFLFCGFVVLVSGLALWKTWRGEGSGPLLKSEGLLKGTILWGSYYDSADGKTVIYEGKHPVLGAVCIFGVGLIAGLLGGGGGIFLVLVADLVMGFPTKVALTMSTLMMGTIALGGLDVYLETGLVNTRWLFPITLGMIMGAFLGARLLRDLKSQAVRGIFLCVLTLLGLEMIWNGVHIFR